MRKKLFLLAVLAGFCSLSSFAQSEEQKVEKVIRDLFDGMRSKNADQVAGAFSAEAIMQTVIGKPEGNSVGTNSVGDFVKRIGSTPAETHLDEQILEYKIQIDGAMAAAWTPYKFYVNGKFSHCGVNSFQLVRLPEGWKIVYIIDTRRKDTCEE